MCSGTDGERRRREGHGVRRGRAPAADTRTEAGAPGVPGRAVQATETAEPVREAAQKHGELQRRPEETGQCARTIMCSVQTSKCLLICAAIYPLLLPRTQDSKNAPTPVPLSLTVQNITLNH